MFAVRSKSGMIFTNTEWGPNNGKEVEYETKAEAEEILEFYKKSFKDQVFFVHEITMGRPPIGITKKVSLTLTENDWEWLDQKAEGNRSKFLRETVANALGNESEWSNYACVGYAIQAAKQLGYDDEQITALSRAIQSEFDLTTVPEAAETYTKSPY